MKQSKLRRRRVIRYAVLYFSLFVVFVGLIAGPVIVGNQELFPKALYKKLSSDEFMVIAQPTGFVKDDTKNETETGINGGEGTATTGNARATASSGSNRLF